MNFKNNDTAIAYLWKWIKENWYDTEVYGYGNGWERAGHWHYKTLWLTPRGAILFNNDSATHLTRKDAMRLVTSYAMHQHPMVRIRAAHIVESWRNKPESAKLHPLAEFLVK